MAKHLCGRNLTVATNALNVIHVLAGDRRTRLLALGGMFYGASQTFLGPLTNQVLKELRVDKAYIGTEAFSSVGGFDVPDKDDAAFKRLAMDVSGSNWILPTHSKYN